MKRGEVYDARLDPTEGSEQAGIRPVVIVSRDAINNSSPVILAVPLTSYKPQRRVYPTHVLIQAPEGGLDRDSIAKAEQVRVLSKSRFLTERGALSQETIDRLNLALLIALDLPTQEKD